jgi:hypothetical protein
MPQAPNFRFKSPQTLAQWLAEKQSNPNVYRRVEVALHFFKQKFPHQNDERLLSGLVCHDYSQPVDVITLPAKTALCGFKTPGSDPLSGTYYAPAGTPLHRAGVGWEGHVQGTLVSKQLVRYVVKLAIPAVLRTRCAPARDMWSDPSRPWGQLQGGGATQYVIPNARQHLDVV